jgi:hypothetical protein
MFEELKVPLTAAGSISRCYRSLKNCFQRKSNKKGEEFLRNVSYIEDDFYLIVVMLLNKSEFNNVFSLNKWWLSAQNNQDSRGDPIRDTGNIFEEANPLQLKILATIFGFPFQPWPFVFHAKFQSRKSTSGLKQWQWSKRVFVILQYKRNIHHPLI